MRKPSLTRAVQARQGTRARRGGSRASTARCGRESATSAPARPSSASRLGAGASAAARSYAAAAPAQSAVARRASACGRPAALHGCPTLLPQLHNNRSQCMLGAPGATANLRARTLPRPAACTAPPPRRPRLTSSRHAGPTRAQVPHSGRALHSQQNVYPEERTSSCQASPSAGAASASRASSAAARPGSPSASAAAPAPRSAPASPASAARRASKRAACCRSSARSASASRACSARPPGWGLYGDYTVCKAPSVWGCVAWCTVLWPGHLGPALRQAQKAPSVRQPPPAQDAWASVRRAAELGNANAS